MFFFGKSKKQSAVARPRSEEGPYADPARLGKAVRFDERFREVISDPVNLLIRRVAEAGYVDAEGMVILHNGLRVPLRGPEAYYGSFSDVLVINRGVHEPLEEYCFQEVLAGLDVAAPVMLELGSYWAHYSMWLKQRRPAAVCHMVESDPVGLQAGVGNFRRNGFAGAFHHGRVGRGGFEVDAFMRTQGLERVDILHADIQGFEAEMLEGAAHCLAGHRAGRVFVSTHSEALHRAVVARLRDFGYIIEVSSPYDEHTTSCDGFVLASAPGLRAVLEGWRPLGRTEIARSSPGQWVASVLPRLTLRP